MSDWGHISSRVTIRSGPTRVNVFQKRYGVGENINDVFARFLGTENVTHFNTAF
jgi:hypothetical protein